MKKIFTLFAVLAVALGMSAADWYLVGANYGWNDDAKYKFTDNGNGTQTLVVEKLSGDIKIKEAGVWNTSFGSNGAKLQEGVEYAAATDGQNIAVDGIIDNATITINPEAHTVLVKGKASENEYTSVYLVGDFGNGWSEDTANGIELKADGANTYKASFNLTADTNYFKFKAGVNVYGTGSGDVNCEIGESYTIMQSGNAFVVGSGDFTIVLSLEKNADQGVFTISGSGQVIVPEPKPATVAIAGAFNNWSTTENSTTEIVDNCAVIVVKNYTNGEGEGAGCKVVYDNMWFGGVTVANGEWVETNDASDAANIDLAAAEGKDVTFTFAVDTHSLKVEWAEGTVEPDPTPDPTPDPAGSLYIPSFSIGAGQTKTVDVDLDTPDYDASAFQFDMTLPAGLSVVYDDEEGEYAFAGTSRLTKSHQINSRKISDNTYRVLCFSTDSKKIKEREGAVVTIDFVAAADFKGGDIVLSNLEIVEPDGKKYNPEDVTVKCSTSGVELVEVENVEAVYYNLQGVRVVNPANGIYVKVVGNKASKVLVK